MKEVRLRERECLSSKSTYPLANGVIPAFHVVGLPCFFTYFPMLARLLVDEIVSFPKVRKTSLVAESLGDACPKHLATGHTVVADVKSNDFTRLATNHRPEPPLLTPF